MHERRGILSPTSGPQPTQDPKTALSRLKGLFSVKSNHTGKGPRREGRRAKARGSPSSSVRSTDGGSPASTDSPETFRSLEVKESPRAGVRSASKGSEGSREQSASSRSWSAFSGRSATPGRSLFGSGPFDSSYDSDLEYRTLAMPSAPTTSLEECVPVQKHLVYVRRIGERIDLLTRTVAWYESKIPALEAAGHQRALPDWSKRIFSMKRRLQILSRLGTISESDSRMKMHYILTELAKPVEPMVLEISAAEYQEHLQQCLVFLCHTPALLYIGQYARQPLPYELEMFALELRPRVVDEICHQFGQPEPYHEPQPVDVLLRRLRASMTPSAASFRQAIAWSYFSRPKYHTGLEILSIIFEFAEDKWETLLET